MRRPLTRQERSARNVKQWHSAQGQNSRASRGDSKGGNEEYLGIVRSDMAKEFKAGRTDVYDAFTLVIRLFLLAMRKRAAGDNQLWNWLLQTAVKVLTPRDEEPGQEPAQPADRASRA